MSYVVYFIFCLFTSFSQHYICCALSCLKLCNCCCPAVHGNLTTQCSEFSLSFHFSFFFFLFFFFFFFLFSQNWLAFSSLDKPMFSEHSSVYFANSQKSAAWNNNAFCKVGINLSRLALFYVTFSPYVDLTALFIDFEFHCIFFYYLGYFLYQIVQECPKCICISESHLQWGRSGSNAQLHNRLG